VPLGALWALQVPFSLEFPFAVGWSVLQSCDGYYEFSTGDTERIRLYNTRVMGYTTPGLIKCLKIVLF